MNSTIRRCGFLYFPCGDALKEHKLIDGEAIFKDGDRFELVRTK